MAIFRVLVFAVTLLVLVAADNEWIAREEFFNMIPATINPFVEYTAPSSVECLLLCDMTTVGQCASVAYSDSYKTCKLYSHSLDGPLPKLKPDLFGHQMYYKKFFCPAGWLKDRDSRSCYYLGTASQQRPSAWQTCEERLGSELIMFKSARQRSNLYTLLRANAPSVTKWWTGYAMFDGALWPRPVEEFPGYIRRRGDCPGSDIMSPPCQQFSIYECYLLCERKYRDRCVAFNYNFNSGACCPKFKSCEISGIGNAVDSGWWFFDKVHDGRPPTSTPNGDCGGSDIKWIQDVSKDQCKKYCRQHPHCVAFQYSNRNCWIKWKSCLSKSGCSNCEMTDMRDINDSPCPFSVRYRDNCLVYHRSWDQWDRMDNMCRQLGGKLTRPTEFQRKSQYAYAAKDRYGGNFWVDYNMLGHYGNWTTRFDGQTMQGAVYDLWPYSPGEPNNCCGTYYCTGVYGIYSDSNGNFAKLDDYHCYAGIYAFCETPISQAWPQNCAFTPNGREYMGTKGVTASNITCANWGSSGYTDTRMFPDWHSNLAFCRNPNPSVISTSPWCIRSDNNQPEACSIPMCPESDWASGQTYTDAGKPFAAITYNAAVADKYDWTVEAYAASANPICSISMDKWCPYYFRGSCYQIYTIPNSHSEAKAICAQNGWHLVSLTTRDEQNFMMGIINRLGYQYFVYNMGYHIGLTGNPSSGYLWDNGEPYSQSFWQPGQPNGGAETCTLLYVAGDGLWHDYYCWFKTWFICEFEIGK